MTLALVACGTNEPEFTVPPNELVFQVECEAQATGLPFMLIFEPEFDILQSQIMAAGVDSLSPAQEDLFRLLTATERTEFNGSFFVPQRVGAVYQPGVTTLEELQVGAGVREVQLYAIKFTGSINESRSGEFAERYEDSLLGHCDSFFEEDIRVACEEGQDGTACFRLERIERRDLGLIEEACELAPYMLLCEPEDPPPYDLPRINEG